MWISEIPWDRSSTFELCVGLKLFGWELLHGIAYAPQYKGFRGEHLRNTRFLNVLRKKSNFAFLLLQMIPAIYGCLKCNKYPNH